MRLTCRAVLFDMDGTLADSNAVVEELWTRFAVATGHAPEDVIDFAHGRPSVATLREFAPAAEVGGWTARFHDWELELFDHVPAVPGAVALTRALPRDRWAVVTSAVRSAASRRLVAIGVGEPPLLIGADDVDRGKPDPEGYARAARELGFAADECVVFEDVEAGLRAAVAAGATAVVIGAHRSEFADSLPRVDDLSTVTASQTGDWLVLEGVGEPRDASRRADGSPTPHG